MNHLLRHSLTQHLRRPTTATARRSLATLGKKDLAKDIAETYEMSVAQSERIINHVFDSIVERVSKGDDVRVFAFGTFEKYTSKATNGRNPKTGAVLEIPSRERIRFRPSKTFKEIVDPSFKK